MSDIARLGIAIDSSQLDKGIISLNQFGGAAGKAEAATQRLGKTSVTTAAEARQLVGAAEAEARAMTMATTAANLNTRALQVNGAASKMAAMSQRNMIYQLNDVAVSLAGGMSLQMVAMQQGSQILQNGVGNALTTIGQLATSVVTKFWPIGVAVGVASAAIAGMQNEINKTSNITVSFGDTALATWQVISNGIYHFIKPATDQIGSWFGAAWDWVVDATKNTGNFIVREIVGAVDIIGTAVKSIPDAFIVAGEAAANGFIGGIEWMVQKALEGIQSVIGAANGFIDMFGGDLMREKLGWDIGVPNLVDPNKPFTLGRADIGGAAASQRLASGWNGLSERGSEIAGTDYMGQFAGAVGQQAMTNARAGLEEVDGAAKKAIESGKKLGDTLSEAAKAAKAEWDFYRGTFSGFFQDLKDGLQEGKGLWESLGAAASNALDGIASRAFDMAANGIFDMIFGSLMGGLGLGAGGAGFLGGGNAAWGGLGLATGGAVRGPGSGTSDSIPAMLSNGEFVVNAKSASQNMGLLHAINGYADGGPVGKVSPAVFTGSVGGYGEVLAA